MTFATLLFRLWRLRLWVGVGLVVGALAAAASLELGHSTVYASASTEILVDSPSSALGNARANLDGYSTRADVFARLMTSDAALRYIGKAAGIPGNLIDASGPVEIDGSAPVDHTPVAVRNGQAIPSSARYKLSFTQNPDIPTIGVYAEAPSTAEAVKLADGAVTGFAAFVNDFGEHGVPASRRIEIRQLGKAIGGVVDPGASKKIAVLVFVVVFAIWCALALFVSRLIGELRAARKPSDGGETFSFPDGPMIADFPFEPDGSPHPGPPYGSGRGVGEQPSRADDGPGVAARDADNLRLRDKLGLRD